MGKSDKAKAHGWDFFLSYTGADRKWAEWVAWQLEDAGYRVLIQAWDSVPGSNWMNRMQEGAAHAERTIALLSVAYLRSGYGQQEWQAAQAADPAGFARKLLPMRIEDCPRPGLLRTVVSIDLFGLPPDTAREHLLAQVRGTVSGRAKPAAAPAFPVAD
ncbi:toll/interleukin-1 receptor domain-containing protein [Frankia sp. AiPs1]|uniref:toll/interleukin-1 receptor domain-containing protein n=1 Tax=Frankia sp. AiPs1 TaxID=573493 RepID=UPI0027E2ED80|nr:toll/interleukin-1 receptor domain-containing protein [Frankia sp. AiPs1]